MGKRTKKTNQTNKNDLGVMQVVPLMLILAIIPLIVRLKIVPLSGVRSTFKVGEDINFDIFSYYKMVWFLIFTSIGIIILFIKYSQNNLHIKKTNIYIPMIIYSILVILSTIFATYKDVALLGFMDRYENVFVLIGYMVCLFLAINVVEGEKQVKYLLYSLGISSIIISAIGIFQLVGLDLFATNFGKKLILPSKIMDSVKNVEFEFSESKKIYATLFNSNYVGVYTSIIFPLSCTLLLLLEDRRSKVFFGIVSLLSFINLLGSGSRTALISVILYVILLIIFFRRLIFKKWKYVLASIIIIVVVLYGVNYYTDGLFKDRITYGIDSIFSKKGSNLKNVILEKNKAKIAVDDYEINILWIDGNFYFEDKNGSEIETVREENKVGFKADPYNQHMFEAVKYQEGMMLKSYVLTNKGWANFNLIVNEEDEFKFVSPKGEMVDLIDAPNWGFKGREGMASGRGYIWSRSIPLLKNTIALGHGPDTFALYFPQDDYIEKMKGMGRVNILVDKPHNFYLQTAINSGVVSLISLIVVFFMYIRSSVKVYIKRKKHNNLFEAAGISIFFSVCCYLMVSFLNDSVVSVAPVFWILLGTGIAINYYLDREEI